MAVSLTFICNICISVFNISNKAQYLYLKSLFRNYLSCWPGIMEKLQNAMGKCVECVLKNIKNLLM